MRLHVLLWKWVLALKVAVVVCSDSGWSYMLQCTAVAPCEAGTQPVRPCDGRCWGRALKTASMSDNSLCTRLQPSYLCLFCLWYCTGQGAWKVSSL